VRLRCFFCRFPRRELVATCFVAGKVVEWQLNTTPERAYVVETWEDEPALSGIPGFAFPWIYAPRCFGMVYTDVAPTNPKYKLGEIATPAGTLAGDTDVGSWETRKHYIAWHPVTGEILRETKPCGWI
jgi:hypothetical protein